MHMRRDFFFSTAAMLDLVPFGLNQMDFVFATDDLVSTKYLRTDELVLHRQQSLQHTSYCVCTSAVWRSARSLVYSETVGRWRS